MALGSSGGGVRLVQPDHEGAIVQTFALRVQPQLERTPTLAVSDDKSRQCLACVAWQSSLFSFNKGQQPNRQSHIGYTRLESTSSRKHICRMCQTCNILRPGHALSSRYLLARSGNTIAHTTLSPAV